MADISANLEKLMSLTEAIPVFSDLVRVIQGRIVEYAVKDGLSIGYGLYNKEDGAVQKNYAAAGTVFPLHIHKEWEYSIILTGEGVVTIGAEQKRYVRFDCIVVPPDTEHYWRYDTNTVTIAITVPASKGYPDGER